jgi:hypothetical protein
MDTVPSGMILAEPALAENPAVVIASDKSTTNTFSVNVFFLFLIMVLPPSVFR